MPKGRYALMTAYMRPGRHPRHADDVPDLHGAGEPRLRLRGGHGAEVARGLALQPVATALFANSPFFDGEVNGWQVLAAPDLARPRPGAHRHAALRLRGRHRVRALRRLRARRADVLRLPRRALHRRAAASRSATSSTAGCRRCRARSRRSRDWADHLTTIFPEVRLKKFIEMRGADGGPWRRICALPALWVGLLYDGRARRGLGPLQGTGRRDARGPARRGAGARAQGEAGGVRCATSRARWSRSRRPG